MQLSRKYVKRDKGISFFEFLIFMVTAGFIVTLVIRLAPVYMDNLSVKTVIESIEKEPDLHILSRSEIVAMINKRLDVNQVQSVQDNNIEVMRGEKDTIIKIQYEVRKHVIANADVVLNFSHQIVVDTQPE